MCTMEKNIFFSNKAQVIGTINAVLTSNVFVVLLILWMFALPFNSHWFGQYVLILLLLFLLLQAFLGFMASFVAWVLYIVKLTKNFIQSKHNPTLIELIFPIGISILTIIAMLYLFTHISTLEVLICTTLFLFLVASLIYKKELTRKAFILGIFAYCFPAIIIITTIIWVHLFNLAK